MNGPVIEINALTKFYGRSRGIEKVDLTVNEGEVFGFIGPNGAGKSTTIRILMNLIFPSGGNASIFGKDVVRQAKQIKKSIGYIPSEANAYSGMDVHGFLDYCARYYRVPDADKRIAELAATFDLDTKRKISGLSTGNKKKVSIVQSLVHSPDLLIMDEPTTGLDPLMQAAFFELLRAENRRGMTIFFSSHVLGEVQKFCKRVAIIKDGKIVQVEDIDTLRKKQLKKVTVEFAGMERPSPDIPGVLDLTAIPGNGMTFMFSGSLSELVSYLSGRQIVNLMIEEPSLEEIFMHYYRI